MKKQLNILLIALLITGILSAAHASEFVEKGTAFIDRKGPNALMFDGHGFKHFVDRYMALTFRTRFYDENGEQISLAELKIPCQAEIEYRRISSSPVPDAISVHVQYYPKDRPVDTRFNLPAMKPEPPK